MREITMHCLSIINRPLLKSCCAITLSLASFSHNVCADIKAGVLAYKSADYTTALKEFIAAGEAGSAQAQYMVGTMYDNGQGTAANDAEALKWYERAARLGFVRAQYDLALMLLNGEGMEKPDYLQAYAWFSVAADKGDAEAIDKRDLLETRMNEPTLKLAKSKAEKLSKEISKKPDVK
jgi:TPR repeat protein